DEIAVVVINGHLPHFFTGGLRAGEELVRKGLVGAKDADVDVGEGNDDGAGQRGGIDQVRGAELLGVVDAVGKDEAALRVRVENFNRFARHGGLDVAGLLSLAAGHVFRGRNDANYFDAGLQRGERAHDAEHGGTASHVVLHFFHAVGGLDGDAAGVEGNGFAYQADHRCARFRVRRRIGDDHNAGRLDASLGDAQERAHLQVSDFLLVQDLDSQAGFLGHGFRFFSEDTRAEFVGRLVYEIAGEVLRVGDDAASGETLFSGSAFRIGKTGDQDRIDVLVVFLVGLVFVSF